MEILSLVDYFFLEILSLVDYFFLLSLISIWAILLINIILAISGYIYYLKNLKFKDERLDEYPFVSILVPAHNEGKVIGKTVESLLSLDYPIDKMELIVINDNSSLDEYPFVSILVPAHNEGKVIGKTVESLLSLDYPIDKMELIVINDNSSDNSKDILQSIKNRHGKYNFTIINTDNITGGKGKSNALNIGYQVAKGDFIAIYDADNTPERTALRYLIQTIVKDSSLGAVIGKFRTRNKHKNILTKFINIETLSFQWIAQAGRRQLLGLCTIPGTNFVLRRTTIEKLGGWDTKAIAEDTEISFRIYKMGQRITYVPQSVTWEQEPETAAVWIKQRTRWVKGNIYVLEISFRIYKMGQRITYVPQSVTWEQEPETAAVWIKQRTRWVKGNIYVLVKYITNLFKGKQNRVLFDILYFFSVYFLFLSFV